MNDDPICWLYQGIYGMEEISGLESESFGLLVRFSEGHELGLKHIVEEIFYFEVETILDWFFGALDSLDDNVVH